MLLKLSDILKLNKTEFCIRLQQQLDWQSSFLQTLRLKRPALIQAFEQAAKEGASLPADPVAQDKWIKKSEKSIAHEYDRLVADGRKWGGSSIASSLKKSLNSLCAHSIHSQLCLSLASHFQEGESNNLSFEENNETKVNLKDCVEEVFMNIGSLSKEKFGVCPSLQLELNFNKEGLNSTSTLINNELYSDVTEDSFRKDKFHLICLPSVLDFVLVELIKNSVEAVIKKFGALDIEDADGGIDGPLIQVQLFSRIPENLKLNWNTSAIDVYDQGSSNKNQQSFVLVIKDRGEGLHEELENNFDAFYSTSMFRTNQNKNNQNEPTWHYSRDFGAPFSGAGFGLLKSKVYIGFHGGKLILQKNPNGGATAIIILPKL